MFDDKYPNTEATLITYKKEIDHLIKARNRLLEDVAETLGETNEKLMWGVALLRASEIVKKHKDNIEDVEELLDEDFDEEYEATPEDKNKELYEKLLNEYVDEGMEHKTLEYYLDIKGGPKNIQPKIEFSLN